jgi:hypothetical protein
MRDWFRVVWWLLNLNAAKIFATRNKAGFQLIEPSGQSGSVEGCPQEFIQWVMLNVITREKAPLDLPDRALVVFGSNSAGRGSFE